MKVPPKLKALWDRKLRASGFEDAEKKDGTLKSLHGLHFAHTSKEELAERQNYFRLATELGTGYKDEYGNFIDVFKGKEGDRKIWLRYCSGYSESMVAKSCGVSLRTISRVISKYNKFIIR